MQIRGIGGELSLQLLHRTPSQNPEEPDLHIRCSAKSAAFIAEGSNVWLEWSDVCAFVQELETLNASLSGQAQIFAMSPSDLTLTIRNLDSRGHMGISFTIGGRNFTDNGQFESTVTGGFEVIPSEVETLLSWFKSVITGGHPTTSSHA